MGRRALRFALAFAFAAIVLAIHPYTPSPAEHVKELILVWAAFVLLVAWLAVSWRDARSLSFPPVLAATLLIFLVFELLGAAFSTNVGYSLFRLGQLAALALLALVAAQLYRRPEHVWPLIALIGAAVVLSSIYGLLQYLGWDFFPWEDYMGLLKSAPATFGNPNVASHALILALILCLGLALWRRRVWAALFLAPIALHLTITRTRGSLVALGTALMLMLVASFAARMTRRGAIGVPLVFTITALVLAAAACAGLAANYYVTGTPYPYGDSVVWRYHSFKTAADMVSDAPMIGRGPGSFPIESPAFWTEFDRDQYAATQRVSFHVHNEPLEFAVEGGLVASGAYVTMWLLATALALSLIWRGQKALGVTLAGFFTAFLADGLFGFNAHAPISAALAFVFLGVLAGVLRPAPHDAPKRRPTYPVMALRATLASAALIIALAGTRDFVSQLYQQQGRGALAQGDLNAAYVRFLRAKDFAPYDWNAPLYAARALMRGEEYAAAVEAYQRALKLNPNLPEARLELARAALNRAAASLASAEFDALIDDARRAAEHAAALAPRAAGAYDVLGRAAALRAAHYKARNAATEAKAAWAEAEGMYLRALDALGGDRAELYRLLAQARLERDDFDGAVDALAFAALEDPRGRAAWDMLVREAEARGRHDVVLNRLEGRIRALVRAVPVDYETLAGAFRERGDYLRRVFGPVPEVEESYQHALRAGPRRPDVWSAYYLHARERNETEAFWRRFSTEFGEDGENAPEPVALAAALWKNGPDALQRAVARLAETLDAAVPPGTAAPDVYAAGWIAALVLDRIDELPPESRAEARIHAAGVLAAVERPADALDALGPLDDDRPDVLLYRAQALIGLGRPAEALPLLRRATPFVQRDLQDRWRLARLLAQAGEPALARLEYINILRALAPPPNLRPLLEREYAAL